MATDAAALGDALEALLAGPLDAEPVLLVVDDLEQVLEQPQQSEGPTPVQARYRATCQAILSAFRRAQSASRRLLTSRYLFTLPDGRGGDLADGLVRVPLQPMEEGDRRKQLRAVLRAGEVGELAAAELVLSQRALTVAAGNPGLQSTLMTPVLSGEAATATKALETIEHYQQTGAPPEALADLIASGAAKDELNAVVAFFERMAFDTYRSALTAPQLRAAIGNG